MFTFVKVQMKSNPNIKYPWMLLCSDMDTLLKHHNYHVYDNFKDGIHEIFTRHHSMTHYTNTVSSVSEMLAKIKGSSIMTEISTLELQLMKGKIDMMSKYNTILLNPTLAYMPLTENFEIVDTIEKNNIQFPSDAYTKKHIRVMQWPGGKHYYAKIANIEVRDEDDNIKWNTYQYAYDTAVEFLKKMNKNEIHTN